MKITRQKLTEMIETEVRAALAGLSEKSNPKKGAKKPSVAGADEDPNPPTSGGGNDPIADEPPVKGGMNDDGESDLGDEVGDTEADADAEASAEKDAEDAVDSDGDASEQPSGAVNDEITGKTVQAITIEPESERLPGAKEIVLAFNETTEPLRIEVTQTGQVKFFWRGQLHDLP